MAPELAGWQWALGISCALLAGMAKTGLPGLAVLISPLMVLMVGDVRLSAGWMLPMLILADLFAVAYWRRHAEWSRLLSLAPSSLAGMGLGAVVLGLEEATLRPMVGAIIVTMLGVHLRNRLRRDGGGISGPAMPYGVAAGFATTVANAAAPIMSLYLLSKRISKEEFLGTAAWFFLLINLSKVPVYVWHGLMSEASLRFDLAVAPAVACGALAGRWMAVRMPLPVFEAVVIGLTLVATVLLFV